MRRLVALFVLAMTSSCASFSPGPCLAGCCGCCSQCLTDFGPQVDGTIACCGALIGAGTGNATAPAHDAVDVAARTPNDTVRY